MKRTSYCLRILFALGFMATTSMPVGAQAQTKPLPGDTPQYCEKEKAQFCAETKNMADLGSCLVKYADKLSVECKQSLERIMQLRKQASARGAGAMSSFGGLNSMGPPLPLASIEGRFGPGDGTTSFMENKASISAPIYGSATDAVSLSLSGGAFHLSDSLTLNSARQLPRNLYRFEFGTQYNHRMANKKNWGIKASFGYAGDRPFNKVSDSTFSLLSTYSFAGSDNGIWVLSIFFSNNNSFANFIPIPGVSYIYRSETFTGMFGFPVLSMQWTPVYPWSFSLMLFGPTIQSEAAYGSIEHIQLFSGFSWNLQNYILNERDQSKDRLTLEEKRAVIGFRTLLADPLLAELQMGRNFDRSLYIGKGLFNKDRGAVSVSADWYLSWSLKARF